MAELLDTLQLPGGRCLSVVNDDGTPGVVPMIGESRARPGDGASEALLALLAQGSNTLGRFTVQSWSRSSATGERAIGVDQTNESVIVGDAAVVKWATHLQLGPHPAPGRITTLRDAGFTGMPRPWGLITWRTPDGDETLVASVDEYLPGAVDGWTWAVELITTAALQRDPAPLVSAAADLGALIAGLHDALAGTASTASAQDAARWRDSALQTLDIACGSVDSRSAVLARERRDDITAVLDQLGTLAGSPVLHGHGDLHVGQILRAQGRFVVTDFDGNPVLPVHERMLPIPAALDVAGLAQSLVHAAVVACKYTELDADAVAEVDAAGRAAFLASYSRHLTHPVYDGTALRPFRLQQVLREIVYAARHLSRWMYVPDAALPALLDERTDL
ncbi:aminoglycoside phosphotransferase [Mycobacterium sp. MS1601]|uniref:glucosamine kinase n=1 Tax=Mycobacterium sp. MS1601 TaxID=1936029 RepID=UPI00097906F4|nr:glucosamine kinase [Mycobacterium sp. MS1601]AQA03674.1 aminoglycoside phosphotransferase [Mycobacterium sp. MS1601]